MTRIPRTLPVVLIAAVLIVVSFSSGAVAAKMITGKQIKDNTVSTKDIKDGSLLSLDLSTATLAELQGATGPAGADGAAGPAGLAGAPGAAGVSGLQQVTAQSALIAGATGSVSADCPAGKKIVGAVADFTGGFLPTAVRFTTDAQAYAYAKNTGASTDNLRISITCITAN